MSRLDALLLRLQRWVRTQPLLYRLTIGTRLLLAVGFIPTGMVKLLGRPFTIMDPASPLGGFFHTLHQSGLWWQFLGLSQIVAGILILIPATATLGAVLFTPIIVNIFVITIAYDFNYTPVITAQMVLACGYLLLWDYDRLRGLFGVTPARLGAVAPFPVQALSGSVERGIYIIGAIAGFAFFGAVRGFTLPLVPTALNAWLLPLCAASAVAAVVVGLHRVLRPRVV
jgi:uncharacterized membrane protein YphA (DoxX/SURF4 family)